MADTPPQEPFVHHQKVRFGDIDPAGVLYYPTFMHYFHMAMEEFMGERVGIPYPEMIEKERMGFATVRIDTEFSGPVRYGDTVDIRVSIARIGSTSVVFSFDSTVDGRPVAASLLTKVALDLDTWKPIVVPPKVRAVFEQHLHGDGAP